MSDNYAPQEMAATPNAEEDVAQDSHDPMPEHIQRLTELHGSGLSIWDPDDGNVDEESDVDPINGVSFCLSIPEQCFLAIIDANPAPGSRDSRLDAMMRQAFGRPRSGVPLTAEPVSGRDGLGLRRDHALLWIAEELVRRRAAQVAGLKPAEIMRKLRELPYTKVLPIAHEAIDLFMPTTNAVRRASLAKGLANDFFGYDRTKKAKKEALKRGALGGDAKPRVPNIMHTYIHRVAEHDYLADSLQTKAAIAICKTLQAAGIAVAHPEME